MSSAAAAAVPPIASPPTGWNQRDHYERYRPPPPYTQKPVFEGSYNDEDEDETTSVHNLNPPLLIDSMGREYSDPIYQKSPPPPPQYPQHPPNPAYPHHLQPHGMQPTGQQPPYPPSTFHDPRFASVTYPPPTTTIGQYVVTLPQLDFGGGQPPTIIVQPGLEDPPSDHMRYSIFVSVCCCWFVGFVAISKSIECRKAIAAGNGDLAKTKSFAAHNTAHAALALGILMYLIAGAIIGFRVASAATRL